MHEEPPNAFRVFVKDVALFVGGDVHTDEESLAVFDGAIGVFKVQGTSADRFDFGASEFNTGFKGVFNEIIMMGLPVLRRDFDSFFFRKNHLFSIIA